MRTLIIPDIHNNTANADYWLATQRYDRVIFLGDYFDDFNDHFSVARSTAISLAQTMDRFAADKAVFLLGNHDLPYMFPSVRRLFCPGWTSAKAYAINDVLTSEHWDRLQIATFEQDWLISHAGFNSMFVEGKEPDVVIRRCAESLKGIKQGKLNVFLTMVGPLWTRWEHLEVVPGINQVVGHTSNDEVRTRQGDGFANWCLDVGNAAVAGVLEDGELSPLVRSQS